MDFAQQSRLKNKAKNAKGTCLTLIWGANFRDYIEGLAFALDWPAEKLFPAFLSFMFCPLAAACLPH